MQFVFFNRRALLYTLLAAVAGSFGAALCGLWGPASKWVTTAGLLLDVAGLVQLEVSGLFSRSLETYQDVERYPYGPPSIMTREIMAEDHKYEWVASLKRKLFMEPRTGFVIIVCGCLVQLWGNWLPGT